MITPARFTYQEMDSEQNRIELNSIQESLGSTAFDWFDNRNKIDVRFCSITELNRKIGVRLGSIEF